MSGAEPITFRRAKLHDLPFIIGLYEADEKGHHGDAWNEDNRPAYEAAFAAIQSQPRDALMVIEADGEKVGTFLLTWLPGLTGRGASHLQLRSVQIRSDYRSRGIGAQMLAYVEDYARTQGATMIEFMSNKTRHDAHRFYERHGYIKSHAGFKKKLTLQSNE